MNPTTVTGRFPGDIENGAALLSARTPQVKEWLDELCSAVHANRDTAQRLVEKLEPVLRSPDPVKDCPSAPEEPLVDVASALREAVRVVRSSTAILNETIQRLEV